MKMLKRLFRWTWLRRSRKSDAAFPPTNVDSDEFTRLLCSGRREDLQMLARKLSQRARAHA
ncbi:hypothetical protein JQ604_23000 [Bradyrhizobium jicamae]|uniref:hypothetical protein n=1 Tax=Bradyrhizobium jicamae TaxID=280332 RepID=UPI001BA73612|nr:hypothetical protein [Bradyrhizobium jicamae]MBR0755062.1 hypothetical protein [Bradyrhizobium jicamae]